MHRVRPAIALAVLVGLVLSGCVSTPAALDECASVIAEHTGTSKADVVVASAEKSSVGAYDWRGTYDGGDFVCASPDGDLLIIANIFTDDGEVERVVSRAPGTR